jgi:hypothetical protein
MALAAPLWRLCFPRARPLREHPLLKTLSSHHPFTRGEFTVRRAALSGLALFIVLVAYALPAAAQQPRVSPHETISSVIDGNRVTVVYGRPYSKNPRGSDIRKIWGALVPYGRVWRMGADEATLLITQQPMDMSGTEIPAGAYTLFLQPEEDGSAKLIVSKQLGQWGTQYDEKQDFARVDIKKEALDPAVDQFTMSVDRGDGGGVLRMKWEGAQYVAPFKIKK